MIQWHFDIFGKLTNLCHLKFFFDFKPAVTNHFLQTKGAILWSIVISIHLKEHKLSFVLGLIDKQLDDPYQTDINCCRINPCLCYLYCNVPRSQGWARSQWDPLWHWQWSQWGTWCKLKVSKFDLPPVCWHLYWWFFSSPPHKKSRLHQPWLKQMKRFTQRRNEIRKLLLYCRAYSHYSMFLGFGGWRGRSWGSLAVKPWQKFPKIGQHIPKWTLIYPILGWFFCRQPISYIS